MRLVNNGQIKENKVETRFPLNYYLPGPDTRTNTGAEAANVR